MLKRRWVEPFLILGLWTLFALYMTLQGHYVRASMGHPATWLQLAHSEFAYAYLWALLTPAILWLARRYRFDHMRWYWVLCIHAVACVVLSSVQKILFVILVPPSQAAYQAHYLNDWVRLIAFSMDYGLLLYCIVLVVYYAVDYHNRYEQGQLRASQLEARLAQTQLQALRMQLHPHFLFNTMHTISTLVRDDPEAAELMIARLSELLRVSLASSGIQEVPLSRELEFVKCYLEIEKVRFEERLELCFDVDPATLDAMVPNLILQPLVENAIRHGIANRREGGRVEVRSQMVGDTVHLWVIDDGPGLDRDGPNTHRVGVGLANTRARLERLYGARHDFVLRSASKGGVEAAIRIPFCHSGEKGNDGDTSQDSNADRR